METGNEVRDGGDSECEGDCDFIADFQNDALIENLQDHLENVTIVADINDDLTNFHESSQRDYANIVDEEDNNREDQSKNHEPKKEIMEGWYPPHPPIHWVPHYKNKPNIPQYDDVNNPGGWSEYTFHAKNCKMVYSNAIPCPPAQNQSQQERKIESKCLTKLGNESSFT